MIKSDANKQKSYCTIEMHRSIIMSPLWCYSRNIILWFHYYFFNNLKLLYVLKYSQFPSLIMLYRPTAVQLRDILLNHYRKGRIILWKQVHKTCCIHKEDSCEDERWSRREKRYLPPFSELKKMSFFVVS